VVVTEPGWITSFVDWLIRPRKKTVKSSGLFHELEHFRVPREALDEAVKKVKPKGYRDE